MAGRFIAAADPTRTAQSGSDVVSTSQATSHQHQQQAEDGYMSDETATPSTDIGSHLSRNYDLEAANTQAPLYICGSCYTSQLLRNKDQIRCRDCGYRILYKQRMRRPMLYSAQ